MMKLIAVLLLVVVTTTVTADPDNLQDLCVADLASGTYHYINNNLMKYIFSCHIVLYILYRAYNKMYIYTFMLIITYISKINYKDR